MAEVYEVQDPNSGERFALKLLIDTRTSIRRFNREFEAMTRLNHPNIVRVYHYGSHDGHPWITMELLEGAPLQTQLKSLGRPGTPERMDEVIRVGYLLSNALNYIHDRGLIHRDLKSANVQVLPDGRIKLIDFGTARMTDPLERITQDGDFVGTFSYAAPEQIVGGEVDHRADIYALGILMYRLCTGRRPFKSTDPQKLAHMHLYEQAPRPRELVPNISEQLESLILWMIEKKRSDRPESAAEVAEVLEQLAGQSLSLSRRGISVKPSRAVGREEARNRVWTVLEEMQPGRILWVMGDQGCALDEFGYQLQKDASRRDWRSVFYNCEEGGGVVGLARAFADLVAGDERLALETETAAEVLTNLGQLAALYRAEQLASSAGQLLRGVASQGSQSGSRVVVIVANVEQLPLQVVQALHAIREGMVHGRVAVSFVLLSASGDERIEAVFGADSTVLELSPLSIRQTALAVGALLHRRQPPPELARRVFDATGGCPAYIEDVVRRLVVSEALRIRGADGNRVEWAMSGQTAVPVPTSAKGDARSQLSRLPLAYRRILEVLQVAGGHGDLDLLAAGMEWSREETELVIDELADSRWIRYNKRTRHIVASRPLALQVIGEQMRGSRRHLLRQLLADPMLARPPDRGQIPVLVAVGRSTEAMRRGVVVALAVFEEEGAGAALDVLEEIKNGVKEESSIPNDVLASFYLLHSRCMQTVRPLDPGSVRSLGRAALLNTDQGFQAQIRLRQAALQKAIGHYVNYRKYLLQSWELLDGQDRPELAAAVARNLARSHLHGGEVVVAQSWFERGLAAAKEADREKEADLAEVGLAECQYRRGDILGAESRARAVVDRERDTHDNAANWAALSLWADVLRRQGRYSEALTALQRPINDARFAQDPEPFVALTLAAAWCEMELFRLGRAHEYVDELLAMLRKGEHLVLRVRTNLLNGRILLESGLIGHAAYVLEEVIEQAERAHLVVLHHQARGILAECRWHMGRHDDAKKMFQETLLGLMGTGDIAALVDACVGRARALRGEEDPSKAFKLVDKMLDIPQLRAFRLERQLAQFRWIRSQGDKRGAQAHLREAAALLNDIAGSLNEIDQSALRVHPWTREIQRGMR